MNYKIELATIDDLNDIHKIIYDRCLWFEEKGVKGWNVETYPKKYNQDYFREQMGINKLFVAKNDNEICGIMLLKNDDKDYWDDDKPSYYLHHLATNNKQKGVGKVLLNYAIDLCKKDNKDYLRLDCYQTSEFLNDYYKKVGFNCVGNGKIGNYSYNLWEMKI